MNGRLPFQLLQSLFKIYPLGHNSDLDTAVKHTIKPAPAEILA